MERFDRDHAFWTETHWKSEKRANTLRTMGSLIIRLDRLTHEVKHRETPPIPLLGYYTLGRVLQTYEPGRTPIESIDNVQLAIEQAANTPQTHDIEKHLAELTVWALDLGKPYWRQSPDEPTATVIDLGGYRNQKATAQELPPIS